MNAPTYLRKQFSNLNSAFHYYVDELTEDEWISRPGPGQNMIAYTVWHMPRIQDNMLQVWIRDQAEIAHSDRWTHWQPLRPFGIGVGITLEASDQISRTVHFAETLAYADEVHQAIITWLGEISEDDLDKVPDAKRRLTPYPEYQTPGYQVETDNLHGLPTWGLLMRPCMGHVHRHLGELEITLDILRKAK